MIVFNCIDCSASYDDWEKANRHREETGHPFKSQDKEEIEYWRKMDLIPKDYPINVE